MFWFAAGVVAVSLVLSGCGTEAPPTPAPTPPPGPPVSTCASKQVVGVLRYWEDGEAKGAFVIRGSDGSCAGPCVTTSDDGRTLTFNAQADIAGDGPLVYLSAHCPDDSSPEPQNLISWNLIGKTIKYNVDVSGLDCRCMAGVYLTGMPKFDSSCPWGYCDAASGHGCASNCQEMDLLQANSRFALVNVQASKNAKADGWSKQCRISPNYRSYGVGKSIDGSRQYRIATTFRNDTAPDVISQVETMWSSGGQQQCQVQSSTREDLQCNATTALKDISEQMSRSGMALAVLNSATPWVDDNQAEACRSSGKTCNLGGFSISDLQIESANDVPCTGPPPAPTPTTTTTPQPPTPQPAPTPQPTPVPVPTPSIPTHLSTSV